MLGKIVSFVGMKDVQGLKKSNPKWEGFRIRPQN
jgi:hypothetical protein